MNQPIPDTIKCVGVRFFANPELEDRTVLETEEMCHKTIGMLEWLNEKRPIIVMMADQHNQDPHCVQVRAMGKVVANVDRDIAPMIRGMLKASPSGKLITQITDVNVYRHGFFYVKMPNMPKEFTAEEIGVDWSQWTSETPIVLPSENFLEEEELSMVLHEVLLPDIASDNTKQLTEYFTLWMRSIRFNQSREVALAMQEYISILSADEREEVRFLSKELDHLRTKRGNPESISELVETWWEPMLCSAVVSDNFATIRRRAMSEKRQLLSILDYMEQLMRPMPDELYNDVGDAYKFFRHLYYLAPPMQALQRVLSLLAIRTLICRELNLSMEPFFGHRVAETTEVSQLLTTIGRVMEFNQTQCRTYEESLTLQRLVEWLERDSRGNRQTEIEQMLSAHPNEAQVIGIKNEFADGSCRFGMGSSMNGNLIMNPKNEQKQ